MWIENDQKNFTLESFCNYLSDICVNVPFALKMAEEVGKKILPQKHQLMREERGVTQYICFDTAIIWSLVSVMTVIDVCMQSLML